MTKVTLVPKYKYIQVTIPLNELVKIKKSLYLTIEETWEHYCLNELRKAGAPIRKRFLRAPVIEKGKVYKEDLPEKDAVRLIWKM